MFGDPIAEHVWKHAREHVRGNAQTRGCSLIDMETVFAKIYDKQLVEHDCEFARDHFHFN